MLIKQEPEITGNARATTARAIRGAAGGASHNKNDAPQTIANSDENTLGTAYPANFTKGLEHDDFGFVTGNYQEFLVQINQDAVSSFDSVRPAFANAPFQEFSTIFKKAIDGGNAGPRKFPEWRGWESPRSGHYYDLQGPDANSVGMAPAPEFGSEELTAEMAEVYSMALLRDVPFSEIENRTGADHNTLLSADDVIDALNGVSYFGQLGSNSVFAKRRLLARLLEPSEYDVVAGTTSVSTLPAISGANLFRGSGPGAKAGPYVSQFMLLGNTAGDVDSEFPPATPSASVIPTDGYIAYGNQFIDQRQRVFIPALDYMTNWNQWLDVQKGADLRGQHVFDPVRRFIATPRHLASYVRFDALYQAYLNACLIMLSSGFETQPAFPEQNTLSRTGFASFGGPHVLSLVTEVATRCLKLARRQKFNFHRRARPERISGLLALTQAVNNGDVAQPSNLNTQTKQALDQMLTDLTAPMNSLIGLHNATRENQSSNADKRTFTSDDQVAWLAGENTMNNLLLPMAFPEGSPMHPSYAAGHATVAGGCVTMLKAFFKTIDINGGVVTPKQWGDTGLPCVQATTDGTALEGVPDTGVTIEGELNKLAANISIARNMAGVHYYSDYYDSVRMGERVTVAMLVEQALGYDKDVFTIQFRSFDGDLIGISASNNGFATINGVSTEAAYLEWFYRHMPPAPTS